MEDISALAGSGNWAASVLYPGSEHRFDPAIGRGMAAVERLGASVNLPYAGAPYAVEGTDMGDESNLMMQRALDLQGGGVSDERYMEFVDRLDEANFDTEYTDIDALVRNARYSDQIGNM